MTTQEAIAHTEELIDWFIEGLAPESEARIREDVEALEILVALAKKEVKNG